jgi:hypothetical protein
VVVVVAGDGVLGIAAAAGDDDGVAVTSTVGEAVGRMPTGGRQCSTPSSSTAPPEPTPE